MGLSRRRDCPVADDLVRSAGRRMPPVESVARPWVRLDCREVFVALPHDTDVEYTQPPLLARLGRERCAPAMSHELGELCRPVGGGPSVSATQPMTGPIPPRALLHWTPRPPNASSSDRGVGFPARWAALSDDDKAPTVEPPCETAPLASTRPLISHGGRERADCDATSAGATGDVSLRGARPGRVESASVGESSPPASHWWPTSAEFVSC